MQGTWKTTSGGGGALAGAVAVIIGAAVAVKYIVVPVLNLAVEVIKLAFISAGVLLVLAVAAFVAYRVRRGSFPAVTRRPVVAARQVPWERPSSAVTPASARAAIGQGDRPELHTHIHLSGLSPEAAEAAIRALRGGNG